MVKDNFSYATPAECGVSYESINNFLDEIESKKVMIHGFALLRGDKIFAEGYYAPFHKDFLHRMYSTSKTYTSMAIGALIAEGKISLDDPVYKFFPDKVPENLHPYIAEATIRHLLMMATPFDRETYGRFVPDWEYSFFNKPPQVRPGTRFIYDTCGTYILDCIVERITGKTFLDYLKDVALREIGFSEDAWCVYSPDGRAWGGSGVLATVRDTVRFATLVKNRGVAHGKQLLPADYIDEATKYQISNTTQYPHPDYLHGNGYGYKIWMVQGGGYAFLGMGCQCALILPDLDFVAVFVGDTQGEPNYGYTFDILKKHVIDHIGEAYEENAEAKAALEERLASLKIPSLSGAVSTETAEKIRGKEYTLFNNPMQMTSVRFEFDGDEGAMYYNTLRGEKKMPFGMAKNVFFKFPEKHFYDTQINLPSDREQNAFASAEWSDENTLHIRTYLYDNSLGNMHTYVTFDGDKIGIKMTKVAEWFMDEYQGEAYGKIKD